VCGAPCLKDNVVPLIFEKTTYYKSSLVSAWFGMAFGHSDLQTTFCEDFSKKVYSNNPQRLEELKHNTEQTFANTDTETLCKIAQNTHKKKGVDACL
jgi:hypothetical protein